MDLVFVRRAHTERGAGEGESASRLTEHGATLSSAGPDVNQRFPPAAGVVWRAIEPLRPGGWAVPRGVTRDAHGGRRKEAESWEGQKTRPKLDRNAEMHRHSLGRRVDPRYWKQEALVLGGLQVRPRSKITAKWCKVVQSSANPYWRGKATSGASAGDAWRRSRMEARGTTAGAVGGSA
jgi:hypothetical protein